MRKRATALASVWKTRSADRKYASAPARSRRSPIVLSLLVVAQMAGSGAAQALEQTELTAPPISGRSLADPDSILPADVLARVELLRENVELIRRFVGRLPASPPLMRVEQAQPHEVYSQARNLESRTNRLAFEQLRIFRPETDRAAEVRPIDTFTVVDSALSSVLLVKRNLGIQDAVSEKLRPESATPSEVFNASVVASSEVNNILQYRTSPSDIFRLVTESVHYAAALHTAIPDGPRLPPMPDFEPNKMPSDVYELMLECLSHVDEALTALGVQSLTVVNVRDLQSKVTPNDVSVLAALLLEELTVLHSNVPEAGEPGQAYHPGVRFPSHVYQRASYLREILKDVVKSAAKSVGAKSGE